MNQYGHKAEDIEAIIRELHPKGYFDREIAEEYTRRHGLFIQRQCICKARKRLGLPSPRSSTANGKYRQLCSTKLSRQLEKRGFDSLVQIRKRSQKKRVNRETGWTFIDTPRELAVVKLINQHGSMTRKQVSAKLGYASRKDGTCGSIDAIMRYLTKEGILVKSPRRVLIKRVLGKGRGFTCNAHLYSLSDRAKREIRGIDNFRHHDLLGSYSRVLVDEDSRESVPDQRCA